MSKVSLNIIFVTSNKNKLREVKQILGDALPIQIVAYETDLLEFQCRDPDDITRAKCIEAVRIVTTDYEWISNNFKILPKQPSTTPLLDPNNSSFIMIEDTALNFNAWGGFLPGPYVKWFLLALSSEGLYQTLSGFEDKSASAVCTFALYTAPGLFLKSHIATNVTLYSKNKSSYLPNRRSKSLAVDQLNTVIVNESHSAIDSNNKQIINGTNSSAIIHPQPQQETNLDVDENGAMPFNGDNVSFLDFSQDIPKVSDILLFKGSVPGTIVSPREPNDTQRQKGQGGFGWDPCFEPDGGVNSNLASNDPGRLTFSQMTSAQKNAISHRSKALINLRNFLIKKYLA